MFVDLSCNKILYQLGIYGMMSWCAISSGLKIRRLRKNMQSENVKKRPDDSIITCVWCDGWACLDKEKTRDKFHNGINVLEK